MFLKSSGVDLQRGRAKTSLFATVKN
jgi:hypothetical protein